MKEFFRTTNLSDVIMLLNPWSKLGFLYSFGSLFLVSFIFTEFVFVLSEFKNSTYGRMGGGSYLHKIEKMGFGNFQSLFGRHYAQHFSVRTDNPHFSSANLVVLPYVVTVVIPSFIFSTWFFTMWLVEGRNDQSNSWRLIRKPNLIRILGTSTQA